MTTIVPAVRESSTFRELSRRQINSNFGTILRAPRLARSVGCQDGAILRGLSCCIVSPANATLPFFCEWICSWLTLLQYMSYSLIAFHPIHNRHHNQTLLHRVENKNNGLYFINRSYSKETTKTNPGSSRNASGASWWKQISDITSDWKWRYHEQEGPWYQYHSSARQSKMGLWF